MFSDILQTKLFIPAPRPRLVDRPQLIAQLNRGLVGRLTLVSAPAGFGKTTLIAAWLNQINISAAWLTLDGDDDTPQRFISYVIAALQQVDPAVGAAAAAGLQAAGGADITIITRSLINDLAGRQSQPLLLVLDDYHTITDKKIHQAVELLVSYAPPNFHLALTSRSDPPLPLPRWRARGELNYFGSADLRFQLQEAGEFLNQTLALDIDRETILQLTTRTEGWAAGLQLAGLSAADPKNFSGRDPYVAEYMAEEVLNRQPPAVRTFLLQTALVERFNPDLGQTLTGMGNTNELLETLEQRNLFLIPLDQERYWYRYHHLFTDLLRQKIRQLLPENEIQALYQRAAVWFADHQLVNEAITYALQAEAWEVAAEQIASLRPAGLWQEDAASQVQAWVKQLPNEALFRHPRAAVLAAAAGMVRGDIHFVWRYLDLMADQPAVNADWHLFQAIVARNGGDLNAAYEHAQTAMEGFHSDSSVLHWLGRVQLINIFLESGAIEPAQKEVEALRRAWQLAVGEPESQLIFFYTVRMEAWLYHLAGRFQDSEAMLQHALQQVEKLGWQLNPLIGLIYIALARANWAMNRLDRASQYNEIAREWGERSGISDLLVEVTFITCDLATAAGNRDAFEETFTWLQRFTNHSQLTHLINLIEAQEAVYRLRLGELDQALSWANDAGLSAADRPSYSQFFHYQTWCHAQIAAAAAGRQSFDSQLLPLLAHMRAAAEEAGDVYSQVQYDLFSAWALDLNHQPDEALIAVGRAIKLAATGSFARPFVDIGPPLLPLLAGLLTNTITLKKADQKERKLIQALLDELMPPQKHEPSTLLSEPLTERENDVLRCLAAGMSNAEIQESLVISKNTVRTHLKNLYAKLDASSRVRAIQKARDLGLV